MAEYMVVRRDGVMYRVKASSPEDAKAKVQAKMFTPETPEHQIKHVSKLPPGTQTKDRSRF